MIVIVVIEVFREQPYIDLHAKCDTIDNKANVHATSGDTDGGQGSAWAWPGRMWGDQVITARPEVMLNIQPETVTVITSRREGVSGDKSLYTAASAPWEDQESSAKQQPVRYRSACARLVTLYNALPGD